MNPIRHGDWHFINGELVDISQSPEMPTELPPTAVTGSDVDGEPLPPSHPGPAQHAGRSDGARGSASQAPHLHPPIHPAPNKRRKSNTED